MPKEGFEGSDQQASRRQFRERYEQVHCNVYALHNNAKETASGVDEPRRYNEMSDGTNIPGLQHSNRNTRDAVLLAFFDCMLSAQRTKGEQVKLLRELFSRFSLQAQTRILAEV